MKKFLWEGLFISPELSLWYSDNYDDYLCKPLGSEFPGLYSFDGSGWQIGGTVAASAAWRQQFSPNFSVDFLTGPRFNFNFIGKVKGFGQECKDLYRPLVFGWRLGAGFNIKSHIRIGVNYDFNFGDHKAACDAKSENSYLWSASRKPHRDAINFSVGYRF